MLDLSNLRSAIRYEGGVSRRLFLAYGSALSAVPLLGLRTSARAKAVFASNPFTLGVASGEPTDTGVVIWTRLAPKPLEEGGGLPVEAFDVSWEVATDDKFKDVVKKGETVATPQLGHSVHVEVEGLKPDRWYFYRFRAGDAESVVGRTRTFPEATVKPEQLKFAFASCQHFEQGWYTAYEHMAKDNLDMVIHLGDYIYEYAGRDKLVRKHVGRKIKSLEDYRIRHAQYRSDPLLNGMHALCPWLVTWDDHEFENNYANDVPEKRYVPKTAPKSLADQKEAEPAVIEKMEINPVDFLEQRANAYQSYYEMMPLRRKSVPHGPDMKLYRTVSFGRLATFQVLDTRQYRSDQPNDDKASDLNMEALSPSQTILGHKQAGWLKGALLESQATWNVLAQQVMMGMADIAAGAAHKYSMDQWPGYAHERMRLMKFIADRRIPNPVVLSGDIHSNWVNDLRTDDRDMTLPVVAAEFVGTSITSGGNGVKEPKGLDTLLAENPFVKFHNRQRGYVRCTVTPTAWKSDYQVVEEVLKPGGAAITKASFVVEADKPGVKPA
ncbi:alkaline phosphatase D family protein [Zavarzinella formosa]|uniref:alkaline phosphatase D family protein n=1 Tax=Zavarzinella formosa TaxID=360055 RepID=UPI0002E1B20D|nr:alkaline phosphatase D family protein [Zavarzinella formosa]